MRIKISGLRRAVVPLIAVLALSLTACGGGDDDGSDSPEQTSGAIDDGDATTAPTEDTTEDTTEVAASSISVDYPEDTTVDYTTVECAATPETPGTYSIVASNEDDAESVLSVSIVDGGFASFTFNSADGGWIATFGAEGDNTDLLAPVTDGTQLDVDLAEVAAIAPSDLEDQMPMVTATGTLTCTSGRLDDEQVSGAEEGDNTVQLSGALDQELVLVNVLCGPVGDGLSAVGRDEDDNEVVITVLPDGTAGSVTVDDTTWTTSVDFSSDGQADSVDDQISVNGNAITLDGLDLEPIQSGDGLTADGVVRCTSGATS